MQRPLFWILAAVGIIGLGVNALLQTPVEVLPRLDFPQIAVIAHQPGATATELEMLVTRPLEAQILSVPDLASVRSVMGDGTLEIDVRFRRGSDPQADLQAINSALDRAHGRLPPGVQPDAQIMGNAINQVSDYGLEIPPSVAPAEAERSLRATLVPALRALPGVQRVELYGAGDEALWVQPRLAALHQYGVPVTALVHALRGQVLLKPEGYLRAGHQDLLIEARHLPTTIAQLERVPVVGPAGPIPLGDLARIVRSAVPTHNAVMLDGRPALALTVFKQPGASTVPVTRSVAATLGAMADQLPRGAHWVRTYDQGHLVHAVGADLGRNLVIGGVLAILALLWVLGAGRGIWVLAFSIPISLVMAIAALHALGHSLNLLTLGALTVSVGLLADDAIIVLESIYHRWEQGESHFLGIRNGVKDIIWPDITGTLTNVAIFVPLLFIGGLGGLFFIPFALAMTLALLASLAVSLVYVPLGLGFVHPVPRKTPTSGGRLLAALRRHNERLFGWVSRYPRLSLGACVLLLFASVAGLVLVSVSFLPLPNEGVLLESFALPPGSSLADTEAAIADMTRRIARDSATAHVWARIGSSARTRYTEPAYAGEIEVVLAPNVNMNSLDRVAARVLAESRVPGIQVGIDTPTIERVGESLSGLPQPFVIHVFGSQMSTLRKLAKKITARLQKTPALSSVFDNDGYPVSQLDLEPRPAALALHHLTPASLDSQLEPLLAGRVIARIPEGNVPLALYMRLADAPEKSLHELAELPIRTTGWTPLGELAKLSLVTTPNQIRHIEGARALDIFALPNGSPGKAISAARQALAGMKLPAGYRISFGGLYPELEQAVLAVGVAAAVAFVVMLGIMVLQFEGLLVPALLLLEIPLALTGGALALVVSGVGLNATGLIAFLTLVGIGLNHQIVLLHRARNNEAQGMQVEDAVREAIHVRFRPIVLTTLTAMLGMVPTALGFGQGAAPEQGLAIVLLGGIAWSALLSTNLIPALYLRARHKQLARGPA